MVQEKLQAEWIFATITVTRNHAGFLRGGEMIGRSIIPAAVQLAAGSRHKNDAEETGGITGIRLIYDMYSGDMFYMNACVSDMSLSGASAEIIKRIGPDNADGTKMEGTISLSREETEILRKILSRYDLAGWSKLPVSASGSAPSRSLIVFSGDDILYDIAWNAKFPKSLPPLEDIMYAQLYNYFNDLIRKTPGWESVRSDNLADPGNNPVYRKRTAVWFGNEVKLVPGTGREDGRYAEIDYADLNWWTAEGFTGTWKLDSNAEADEFPLPKSGTLTVKDDGTAELMINGEIWNGTLSSVRRYQDDASMTVEHDGETRSCTIETANDQSYESIRIVCIPGPVPEPQFDPVWIPLVKEEKE